MSQVKQAGKFSSAHLQVKLIASLTILEIKVLVPEKALHGHLS
jgi:hypothetical protein